MKILGFILLLSFLYPLSGCSTTKKADIKAYGLYMVVPALGSIVGLGMIDYKRRSHDSKTDKITPIENLPEDDTTN